MDCIPRAFFLEFLSLLLQNSQGGQIVFDLLKGIEWEFPFFDLENGTITPRSPVRDIVKRFFIEDILAVGTELNASRRNCKPIYRPSGEIGK
jgi:hypothetical protein